MTAWKINGRDVPAEVISGAGAAGPLPRHRAARAPQGTWVFLRGRSYFVEAVRASRPGHSQPGADDGTVVTPMPGKIFKLLVGKGDTVKAGQELVVLEAMKMEHALKAPRDGKIAELKVLAGELVESGQVVAVVK